MKTKTVWVTRNGNDPKSDVIIAPDTGIVKDILSGQDEGYRYLDIEYNTRDKRPYESVCAAGFEAVFGFVPAFGTWLKLTCEVPEVVR